MGDTVKSTKARLNEYQEDLWKLMTPKYKKRVLTVSILHISEAVNNRLQDQLSAVRTVLLVERLKEGYLIYAPNPPSLRGSFLAHELRRVGEPELANLVHLAVSNGFDMIQLDTSGPELPLSLDIPLFDW